MPKCQGGNWWVCIDHVYNNCRFENCSIYDDNVGFTTYKGNWQQIPIYDRVAWIKFLLENLRVNSYELVDGIGHDKRKTVIKKLNEQLAYLTPAFEEYKKELLEVIKHLG